MEKYIIQGIHFSYLKKINLLSYILYCVNHKLNTLYKKMLFNKNKCNGKIEFNRQIGDIYMINEHNNICDKKSKKIYDNLTNLEIKMKNGSDFKLSLINILYVNPLIIERIALIYDDD